MASKTRRQRLTELLDLLTPKQVDLFWKLFPYGTVADIPTDRLSTALGVCEHTAKKNHGRVLDVLASRHPEDG